MSPEKLGNSEPRSHRLPNLSELDPLAGLIPVEVDIVELVAEAISSTGQIVQRQANLSDQRSKPTDLPTQTE